ncbi:methyltransferase domain-containing protein [Castellaniella sp.]|uniref:class I SAM-dependent methyltransferase n=1 Tax=Castellaniella sp. TaxID=1955812 RepID=UPI0025C643A1|nr:methyltransferase domain-containing protein [Castellaniella sp.]
MLCRHIRRATEIHAVARTLPATQGESVTWTEGSATNLPFQDAAFDLVLCQHGLQFFPDRNAALREIHRVLTPGGRSTVIVGQAVERHPVFDALMNSVARHLGLPLAAVALPFALHDVDDLRALYGSAGFGAVEITPESIHLRFPQADRFVPLAVASSAAAVPPFAQLESSARARLLDAVREETEPVVNRYREGDIVSFPMHAYVINAST